MLLGRRGPARSLSRADWAGSPKIKERLVSVKTQLSAEVLERQLSYLNDEIARIEKIVCAIVNFNEEPDPISLAIERAQEIVCRINDLRDDWERKLGAD